MKEKLREYSIPLMMVVSFLVWIFIFRGFLTGELAIVKDAVAYWSHFRFYITNLLVGTYPFWDPHWNSGVPIEFFLRRIGNYNPLYLIILLLYKSGLSLKVSYLFFLTFYYFLGMIAFFLIAKHLLKDSLSAFLAFLLLMFSSLSTLLFFSFITLFYVPIFWFFYFLLAFCERQEKHYFIGMIFTLMIIVTTYIPFYFLTVFLVFMACTLIFYFKIFCKAASSFVRFIRSNKRFIFICILILLVSLGPGIMLYQSAEKGGIALPARHKDAPSKNVFTVGSRKIAGGDITSQIYFDRLISDLDELELGVLYIPLFAYVVLLLGLLTQTNKKIIYLSVFGSIIFLIALTDTTPLHKFLYKHVFYFKFIRLSYHFLWFAVLPAFILIIAELFRKLTHYQSNGHYKKKFVLTYVVLAHIAFFGFLLSKENIIWSSFLVILLSLIFFGLLFAGRFPSSSVFPTKMYSPALIVLFCLVVIQPLEAYSYLSQNAIRHDRSRSQDKSRLNFQFVQSKDKASPHKVKQSILTRRKDIYYCTPKFYLLFKYLDYEVFREYINTKFIVYDRVVRLNDEINHIERINRYFAKNINIAFIHENLSQDIALPDGKSEVHAQKITENSSEFKMIDYNVNMIKFYSNFSSPKFLVYNDNYHDGWQAFINGQRVKLYRANVAFKGIWLPAGENWVIIRFLPPWRTLLSYFYILLFFSVFCWLLYSWRRFVGKSQHHSIKGK